MRIVLSKITVYDIEDRREPDHEQREAQLIPLVDQEVLPAALVAFVRWSRHQGQLAEVFEQIVGTIFFAIKSSMTAETQSSLANA